MAFTLGLQMILYSLQNSSEKDVLLNNLKNNNKYITDYLLSEIFEILEDDIKEFLLMTSILDKFNSSLCNYITKKDNSQSIIEKIENRNLFIIPLDEERTWYRYHNLFSELLYKYLKKTKPEIIEELHNRSAR